MNQRYLSIDFFRGLTIAFMIIVNTPGTGDFVYPQLRHAVWHGCTFTDLVFPSFMFMFIALYNIERLKVSQTIILRYRVEHTKTVAAIARHHSCNLILKTKSLVT